jgi:hypothetical protein
MNNIEDVLVVCDLEVGNVFNVEFINENAFP